MQTKNHNKIETIHNRIEQRILSGEWKVGGQIPTEEELAAEFGCSRGTVSKAIALLAYDGLLQRRKRAGTTVLGNASTRTKTDMELDACAFVYPSEQHEGVRRIVQGFQDAAREVNRRVVTITTGMNFQKEAEIVGRMSEFGVKGAVVYPVLPEVKDRLYFAQMMQACQFPVVLTDITLPGFCGPAVAIDGFHAGYTMTRHLLAQGLERIGFMTNYAWVPSFQNRYRGYCWAMDEAGLKVQPDWTSIEQSMRPNYEDMLAEGLGFTKRFLENARELQGVVCANDFLALACMKSARELGMDLPGELKVVGIDDFAIAAQSQPTLTTYRVPYEQMGREAFGMLNRMLQGEKVSATETLVRGRLMIRQSC